MVSLRTMFSVAIFSMVAMQCEATRYWVNISLTNKQEETEENERIFLEKLSSIEKKWDNLSSEDMQWQKCNEGLIRGFFHDRQAIISDCKANKIKDILEQTLKQNNLNGKVLVEEN